MMGDRDGIYLDIDIINKADIIQFITKRLKAPTIKL